jgi:hypothetical protein
MSVSSARAMTDGERSASATKSATDSGIPNQWGKASRMDRQIGPLSESAIRVTTGNEGTLGLWILHRREAALGMLLTPSSSSTPVGEVPRGFGPLLLGRRLRGAGPGCRACGRAGRDNGPCPCPAGRSVCPSWLRSRSPPSRSPPWRQLPRPPDRHSRLRANLRAWSNRGPRMPLGRRRLRRTQHRNHRRRLHPPQCRPRPRPRRRHPPLPSRSPAARCPHTRPSLLPRRPGTPLSSSRPYHR